MTNTLKLTVNPQSPFKKYKLDYPCSLLHLTWWPTSPGESDPFDPDTQINSINPVSILIATHHEIYWIKSMKISNNHVSCIMIIVLLIYPNKNVHGQIISWHSIFVKSSNNESWKSRVTMICYSSTYVAILLLPMHTLEGEVTTVDDWSCVSLSTETFW